MRTRLSDEILTACKLSVLGFRQRWLRSLTTVVGTAGVVAVFVSVLSIARGYQDVVKLAAGSDNVMVMMNGATSELISTLSSEQASLVRNSPSIARDAAGLPLVSAEAFTTVKLERGGPNNSASVVLRGVEPAGIGLRQLRIVQGRSFVPGRQEVIVGRQVLKQFVGLRVGGEVRLGSSMWTVVGLFEAGNPLADSEVWTDAATMQTARRQGNHFAAVYLRLRPDVSIRQFEAELARDPRIRARVLAEQEYVSEQSHSLTTFVEAIGYGTTLLMAFGAIFAALNTNHAGVAQRSRELATLKALGFRDAGILAAVILESLVLALAGGLLAALACYWALNGYTTSTLLASHSYSAVVFAFQVSAGLLLQAVLIAVAIGVAGALWPAIAILHLPTTRALAQRG